MATTRTPSGAGVIYLLHLDRRLTPAHPCRHYLGWTDDLDARLAEHAAGRGARLLRVARERGIAWELARTWPGDRAAERRLKRRKGAPDLCPLCVPASAAGTEERGERQG